MKVGDRYGRWTLLRYGPHGERRGGLRSRWTCRCVCGVEQAVWQEDLVTSRSRGCRSSECRSLHDGRIAAVQQLIPTEVLYRLQRTNDQQELEFGARLNPGFVVGRWRVLRPAAAATDELTRLRPMVVVECVCGVQRRIPEKRLKLGRSLGCSEARCREEFGGYAMLYSKARTALVIVGSKSVPQSADGQLEKV